MQHVLVPVEVFHVVVEEVGVGADIVGPEWDFRVELSLHSCPEAKLVNSWHIKQPTKLALGMGQEQIMTECLLRTRFGPTCHALEDVKKDIEAFCKGNEKEPVFYWAHEAGGRYEGKRLAQYLSVGAINFANQPSTFDMAAFVCRWQNLTTLDAPTNHDLLDRVYHVLESRLVQIEELGEGKRTTIATSIT